MTRTSNETPDPAAQRLEISIQRRHDIQNVDAIEVRVRGVGSARQTLPLRADADGSRADDLQQSFQLRRTSSTPTLTRSEIRVPRMNAIAGSSLCQ